jgi:hypothetical protein
MRFVSGMNIQEMLYEQFFFGPALLLLSLLLGCLYFIQH